MLMQSYYVVFAGTWVYVHLVVGCDLNELYKVQFQLIGLQDYSEDFDAESEDIIPTSPGTILHYFACLNYVEGVHTLLHDERYRVFHSRLNKNGLTPLWIASWYNNIRIGVLLLRSGANPNDTDPEQWLTPLHCAIYGYHLDRADDTAEFVGELIENGADTTKVDRSGETPAHLVVGTLDFRLMTKFIDELGAECLNLKDDSGNTLFHFAVGCVDEHLIYRMIGDTDTCTDNQDKFLNYHEVAVGSGTAICLSDKRCQRLLQ